MKLQREYSSTRLSLMTQALLGGPCTERHLKARSENWRWCPGIEIHGEGLNQAYKAADE